MTDAPEPYAVTDLAALKALAHPRRQRILKHLGLHGPATSATLARALDLNTGATSYHLRKLARHGFVEEAGSAGVHGRERWWRRPRQDLRFPPRSEQDAETRSVMNMFNRLAFARDMEAFRQAQDAADPSDPWSDAFPYSHGSITVTLEEFRQFFEDYIALLKRYQRDPAEASDGARVVLTRFFGFPAPAEDRSAE